MAQDTSTGPWSVGRAHKNIVVVALVAELARIVWAVLRKDGRSGDRGGAEIGDHRTLI